jgi:hypothetical protein
MKILDNLIENGFSVSNDVTQLSDVAILRVVGESALQVGNWRKAGQLLASVYELSPRELLSNFDFIKAYVLLMVIERFYLNLDIATRLSWVSGFCRKHKENSIKIAHPKCIKGKRACPIEDCGGVWRRGPFYIC